MGICLCYARSMPYVIKMAKTHTKLREKHLQHIFSPSFKACFAENGLKWGFQQAKSSGNAQLFMSLGRF